MRNKLRRAFGRWLHGSNASSRSRDLNDHFILDYNKHVANLRKSSGSIEEAMSLAVGGNFAAIGQIHSDLLRLIGLRDGMRVIDLGCGSGRTAVVLARDFDVEYHGVDVVQPLLDHAKANTPANIATHM